ncbi:MAG: hypothetical protein ACI4QN_01995, partial [Candidatus Coproplasma sp.]
MKKIFKLALSLVLASSLAFCAFGCTNKDDGGKDNESSTENPIGGGEGTTPEEPEQGGEGTTPEEPEQGQTELTYNQKIERYLDGTASTAFTSFVSSLAQYDYDAPIKAGAIYASPDGNGDGTFNDPYSLQDGLDEVKAGGTLYLRGGVYNTSDGDGYFINCSGTAANYVTIRNYPGEKAVIENS